MSVNCYELAISWQSQGSYMHWLSRTGGLEISVLSWSEHTVCLMWLFDKSLTFLFMGYSITKILDSCIDVTKKNSYLLTRDWKSSATHRCVRRWQRTHHLQTHPPPPHLPHHLCNPCRRSRWTGWRSHGQSQSTAQRGHTSQETTAPLANHCTPSRQLTIMHDLEVLAPRIGSFTEARHFHPGREPDLVAKNRIFHRGRQNDESIMRYDTTKSRMYIIVNKTDYFCFHLTLFLTSVISDTGSNTVI